MILPERVYGRDGRIDWRASIDASLAAHPLVHRRWPAVLEGLARSLPVVGRCYHCGTPWGFVRAHATAIDDTAVYVLCESCWAELPVAARLAYYQAKYRVLLVEARRHPYGPQRDGAVIALMDVWPKVLAAVRAGG